MFTSRRAWRFGIGILALGALVWAPWGCGGVSKTTKTEPKVVKKKKTTRSKKGAAGGLVFTLSAGEEQGAGGRGAKVVKGRKLTASERQAILARLPAMEGAGAPLMMRSSVSTPVTGSVKETRI